MTALPANSAFTGASVTEGAFKTAHDDLRTFLSELLGATGNAADSVLRNRTNAFINGNFDVWQRGTSFTVTTAGAYTADRWEVVPVGASVNVARDTAQLPDDQSECSLKITGAASVTTVDIRQRIEAADVPLLKGAVTIDLQVYNNSGAAFTPDLRIGTPTVADDFTTVTNRLAQTLGSCADTAWTRVSYSVDISGYTDIENGIEIALRIPSGSLVAGDVVQIAQAHAALGNIVMDFEPSSIALEMLRCQRYYQKSYSYGDAPGTATDEGRIYGNAATSFFLYNPDIQFAGNMRTAPTITTYSTNTGTGGKFYDTTAAGDVTGGAFNQGETGFTSRGTGGTLTATNWYAFQWEADAEL